MRLHHGLIPLLALLAVLPLLIHGCSCGHDMWFHVQSWLDAAQQLGHGSYPQWAFSPAWQAGEPRFIFYPPLSWLLGAGLMALFSANWTPVIFTWIVLMCAGFSMYRLAREFAPADAALVASAVYLANPYMMFNAFERAAYAELFASIWIPLLLLAVLRKEPTVRGLAVPLGLVWLTNAPAGVMASYTLVLLGCVRLLLRWFDRRSAHSETRAQTLRLGLTIAGGITLGLALVSFYLLPAAYERRFVQVDMAIIPNLRYQDNFLFSRTDYEPHNVVTHTVSVLGLTMLIVTVAVVIAALYRAAQEERKNTGHSFTPGIAVSLAVLTAVIALLMFPLSSPVWAHLPNLKFLQFPWRLLTILSAVLALALAPLLQSAARFRKLCILTSFVVVLAFSQWSSPRYRQRCEANELPSFDKQAFDSGHGVSPTDEYTPAGADNDLERTDNPAYWVAASDANAYAPGTIQNPNEINANYDGPIPFENTVAARAPQHVEVTLPKPETLVFNLRDYPAWRVTRNGSELPRHVQRDDGLLAIALPAGSSAVDIRWQRAWDEKLGFTLSGCALLALGFTFRRSRRIET